MGVWMDFNKFIGHRWLVSKKAKDRSQWPGSERMISAQKKIRVKSVWMNCDELFGPQKLVGQQQWEESTV